LDQQYLRRLEPFHDRMVFGINQIDLIEPSNWSTATNCPSKEQRRNIEVILADRAERIGSTLGRQPTLIPYSATRRFGLQELFTALVETTPSRRSWIFSMIKNFDPFDFIPANLRGQLIGKTEKR
jgi:predicted GTPase